MVLDGLQTVPCSFLAPSLTTLAPVDLASLKIADGSGLEMLVDASQLRLELELAGNDGGLHGQDFDIQSSGARCQSCRLLTPDF